MADEKKQQPPKKDETSPKMEPKLLKKANDSYEKFMKAAGTSLDEVSMILRSHLLAEYYIDHIIVSNLPRGDVLVENRFTFMQKLKVVEALNVLQKEDLDSIKNLNSIRNACAHNLDYQIDESDVDCIGRPYGKQYLKIKEERFQSIKTLLHWTLAMPIMAVVVVSGR